MAIDIDTTNNVRRLRVPVDSIATPPNGSLVSTNPGAYFTVLESLTLPNGDLGLWLREVEPADLPPGATFVTIIDAQWATPARRRIH